VSRTGKENLATLAQEINRDLQAIRGMLRRPLQAEIARGNLTGPQQSAMSALVRSGAMSLKELSSHLGLAHSTTSGIVDRLEKRGMVERQPDSADRRLTRIAATRDVKEFVKNVMPGLGVAPLLSAMRRAKPAQRDAILQGVKTLRHLLETSEP
jgi:DNA-binding MarR family transcriptional regulator